MMVAHDAVAVAGIETLADDTEETLAGSSLHQQAITALYDSLTLCGPYAV